MLDYTNCENMLKALDTRRKSVKIPSIYAQPAANNRATSRSIDVQRLNVYRYLPQANA